MTEISYAPGDVVFCEGDPSNFVCQIVTGEVEVVKGLGEGSVPLGRIAAGDFVGEMGVIEGKARGATVRAIGALTVTLFGRDEFLRRVSEDNALALKLLERMSERLSFMNAAYTDITALADRSPDPRASDGAVVIFPASDRLASQMTDRGVAVESFPFVVGRMPVRRESTPTGPIHLRIEDARPFRLSRSHFRIEKLPAGYVVRDLGSKLGTRVNDVSLGYHFNTDVAPLRGGENLVLAGGIDSPFAFRISVEQG